MSNGQQRDLVVLVADLDMEHAIRELLAQPIHRTSKVIQ